MDASVLLYLIDYQSTCGRSAGIFLSSLKQLRTAQWNALFDMAISYQVFGYLDRVQCRSFTDLVADTPEGQSVRVGNILADTAHIDRIATGQQQRHRIFLLVGFIHQHDSLGTAKCFAGLSTDTGRSASSHTASECARITGTRIQVALTSISECIILRVSLYIFISSFV